MGSGNIFSSRPERAFLSAATDKGFNLAGKIQ
jgi:hypothetical protein